MKTKKERLKGYLKRKEVLAGFLVLFLIFGFYSVKLMSTHSYSMNRETVGTYTQEGKLLHTAILKDNALYGTTMRSKYYPAPLVEGFLLTYAYRFAPMTSVEGTYDVVGIVTYAVNRGDKEVVLWKEKLFEEKGKLKDGKFTVEYKMNLSDLNRKDQQISDQLGIKRLRRSITITANVKAKGEAYGKAVSETFTHTISLVRDSTAGLYYFDDPEKITRKSVTTTSTQKNSVKMLGIQTDVETAKKVVPLLALIFLIPLMGGAYTIKSTMPHDDFKRIRPYIVEGVPRKVDRKVIMSSRADLEKAFELVDKPILHYIDGEEDVYAIIDDSVAYEYRELVKNTGEDDINIDVDEEPEENS
ncbi:DUF5305 family protein [Thermococcus sp.]